MAVVGQACLIIALGLCAYGATASVLGARSGRDGLVLSGRRALYALAAVVTIAFVIMEAAFWRSDFTYTVVAQHSSTTTPWYYRLAAAWSSQEGSLLLWLWLLSVWSTVAFVLLRGRLRDVAPYAAAVLLGLGAFFSALLLFTASPFATVASAPAEGMGLNPLLRHPSMMSHPVMLYSGYTLFSIPFAFAIGALIVRRVDAEWIRATRFFTLGAWLALGFGIILGARWAYAELGWGGYWAWDPVENASLLPWLTGTAFLHSVMIQERRGMLKVWNASLILATGVLCILGTFLVRSGILDSIHAFVQEGNTIAWSFTALICVMIAGAVWLVTTRRHDALRSDARIDAFLSRESMFLANNLVFVGLAFGVFWGTFFPLISEAVTGEKAAVGPPWFDRYTVPLALLLVLLSGIGPVIAWRRSSASRLWRSIRGPAISALVVTALVLVVVPGATGHLLSMLLVLFAVFAIGVAVQELWRGTRARQAMTQDNAVQALGGLITRNRRRYGGYLVHIGISVLFIGVALSAAFEGTRDVRLTPGTSATVKGYTFTYEKPTGRIAQRAGELERIELGSVVRVTKDGEQVATLRPSRGYYPMPGIQAGVLGRYFEGESTSEIGLRGGVVRDLWVAEQPDITALQKKVERADALFVQLVRSGRIQMTQAAEVRDLTLQRFVSDYAASAPSAQFRILVSPMVFWIWVGAAIVFLGGIIAIWPAPGSVRGRVRARYAARVARDLGRA
ncbi:MAG: cytochrome c biogenesis protein CcsA [Solirubrobacteraceae bacterium]|nr:cytochrome c biogenesis protein CcsA [Solirubrobacteraceae bacterium]